MSPGPPVIQNNWKDQQTLVGGFSPTHLKNMLVKMGEHLPQKRDEHSKNLWVATNWVFPKIMVPPNHPLQNRVFHNKPIHFGGKSPIWGNSQFEPKVTKLLPAPNLVCLVRLDSSSKTRTKNIKGSTHDIPRIRDVVVVVVVFFCCFFVEKTPHSWFRNIYGIWYVYGLPPFLAES